MAMINGINNCEIFITYRKPKPRPIVHFPLAKRFNETVTHDLKQWVSNTLFHHLADHLTRYGASCVTKNKHKEIFCKRHFG